MYITVHENEGVGVVLDVLYREVKDKKQELKEQGEADLEKSIRDMQSLAQRQENAAAVAYEIKRSQQDAWADMLANFYGVPWEQVALLAGVVAGAAYLLWSD